MRSPIDIDPERFRAVAQLLADLPDLDIDRIRTRKPKEPVQ